MGIEELFKTLHLPTHWTLLPVGVHQPHGEGAYYSRTGLGRAPLKLETRQGSLEASSLGPCCPPPSTCSIPLCKISASPDQQADHAFGRARVSGTCVPGTILGTGP